MDIMSTNYMAIVRWWARGAIGANLSIVSVYITTFYSFARSLLSALYCHTVMIIANLVKVLGGGGGGGGGD